eukprot:3059386-Alexandrium_andersonii.AAC.1
MGSTGPAATTTGASRPGAALPAVGCSAPPCLLALPRFRVAAARWWRRVVCAVLRASVGASA